MNIKEKLRVTGRRSKISVFIGVMVIIYLVMLLFKTIYIDTGNSNIGLIQNIHFGFRRLINFTMFLPIGWLWDWIPYASYRSDYILGFYKPVVPAFVILTICGLFIQDHQALKAKFKKIKMDIEDEIIHKQMRKEAGLVNAAESVTIDVLIDNKTNNDPAWHDTWWGKLVIGVAIALIIAAFGIS